MSSQTAAALPTKAFLAWESPDHRPKVYTNKQLGISLTLGLKYEWLCDVLPHSLFLNSLSIISFCS